MVMIFSIVFGVAFVPLVGKLADSVNPQIMLPAACCTRFLSIVGFYLVKNVNSPMLYVVSIWMVLGTLMETVCTDAIMFRNCNRQLRGIVNGVGYGIGYLGQFIFSLLGGWLYDEQGPKAPFFLCGLCDFILMVVMLGLVAKGTITNDLQEKADAERLGKENKA